jgi:ATP-dependent DNA helicase RecQ
MDPSTARLFEALRKTRLDIALAQKSPAYVICHDKCLIEMAKRRPDSRAALREVYGMGPARIQSYGDRFLVTIQETR